MQTAGSEPVSSPDSRSTFSVSTALLPQQVFVGVQGFCDDPSRLADSAYHRSSHRGGRCAAACPARRVASAREVADSARWLAPAPKSAPDPPTALDLRGDPTCELYRPLTCAGPAALRRRAGRVRLLRRSMWRRVIAQLSRLRPSAVHKPSRGGCRGGGRVGSGSPCLVRIRMMLRSSQFERPRLPAPGVHSCCCDIWRHELARTGQFTIG